MRFNYKKQMASVISAALLLGSVSTIGFAAADNESTANEVSHVYNYIEAGTEVNNVSAAKASLARSEFIDTAVSVMGDELITDALIDKYGDEEEAKEAVANILVNSLRVYFATSPEDFTTQLTSISNTMRRYTNAVFGTNTVEQWISLYTVARKNAQTNQSAQDRWEWALGTKAEVYQSLDDLQVKNMDIMLAEPDYSAISDAFTELGWTSQMIVDACRNIIVSAEDNNIGEWVLIKAAARSVMRLTVNGEVVELAYAGNDLSNENNYIKVSPDDFPATLNIQLETVFSNRITDVTHLVRVEVSDTNVAQVTSEEDADIITVDVSERGTSDVNMYRVSGPEDWLTRFRIVAAYDIDQVVFDSVLDGTKATWSPVEHADHYVVEIFKDGEKIGEKTVNSSDALEVDFADYTDANGSGDYTAKATAYGDIAEEVGPVSEASPVYTFTATIGTPEKPSWTNDTPVVTWNAVEGADSYIVTVYDEDGNAVASKTVTGTEADFTDELSEKNGSFYAAVKAAGNGVVGDESEKSDELVLGVTITGKVQLEGYYYPQITINGGDKIGDIRVDNSGVLITVKELPQISGVVSEADGSYELKGLPRSYNGKYTLIYERTSYLKTKQEVSLDSDKVVAEDQYMYFGDLTTYNTIIIDILDVTAIVNAYGTSIGDSAWDERYSMGDDESVNSELSVVTRNYNRQFVDE